MSRTQLLCIAGGGTGGHVMPALSLADAARQQWPALHVSFIGAERGLEASMLPKRGEDVLLLKMHAVQGSGIGQRLRVLLWELPKAVMQIRRTWKGNKPDVVVGVGGYASVSGVIAAILSRVPVVLYEQNAVPGMVNRYLSRFCQRIMLGFAEAAKRLPQNKCIVTGNIIREDIRKVHYQAHQPPCLLVLGGSQGAMFLNNTVPEACAILRQHKHDFSVVHVCGDQQQRIDALQQRYRKANISHEVIGFCHDMPAFYSKGDVMIARAGAMSVGEAAMIGMPTLFVPLPHAADQHQYFNAKALSDQGAAIICQQQQQNAESLAQQLADVLFNIKNKQAMHQQALAWSKQTHLPEAGARQLQVLSEFLEVAA